MVKSRGYQLEMLEKSLKENIIVTVYYTLHWSAALPINCVQIRWIPAVVKHICKPRSLSFGPGNHDICRVSLLTRLLELFFVLKRSLKSCQLERLAPVTPRSISTLIGFSLYGS